MRITATAGLPKIGAIRTGGGKIPTVKTSDELKLYKEHDKIVLKETGEVFTVHADFSARVEPGIAVKEKIGRLLLHCEVRPAGRTRQRSDAAVS